ncbi:hypothetical protein HDV05_000295, partial [Chytridiales sp. JEL 0842]
TSRYCAIVSKILTAAAKTEQFYRNRKKQKGSGGGGGGDDLLLASERIRAQMTLDVAAYKKELIKFGVGPDMLTSFKELEHAINEHEQVETSTSA